MRRMIALVALLLAGLTARAEEVKFPGPEFHGDPVTLTGFYTLPKGAAPHPAVILMPSASGTWSNDARWAERFNAWGFAALRVESLTPRGYDFMGLGITLDDLAVDLGLAIEWLRAKPEIEGSRIYVAGWSAGGAAVLLRLGQLDPAVTPAAIAIYPSCKWFHAASDAVPVPVLLIMGGADRASPPAACREDYKAQIEKGLITFVVYPEAAHLFDAEAEKVYRPTDAEDAAKRIRAIISAARHE